MEILIISTKVLRDKPFDITKNLKSNGYQDGIASVVYLYIF